MRWIFFVLLAANALLLGWNLFGPETGTSLHDQNLPAESPNEASITLVSEKIDSDSSDRTPPTTAGSQPENEEDTVSRLVVDVAEADKTLCVFVGPFDSADSAEQLVERLAAMEVGGSVADVEIPAGPGYWVYIAPLDSRREALRRLSELQAQGIDSYIIPRGDLVNGISLGMFSRESLAQARAQEMAEQGVETETRIIERTFKEIWVSIPARDAAALNDRAWERLLLGHSDAERRQNFCLHVASQDNFH